MIPPPRRGRRPRPEELAAAGRLLAAPDAYYLTSLEDLAAELGVTRRTLYRWRGRPEFLAAFAAAEADPRTVAKQAKEKPCPSRTSP